jgi:4-amino-4-deoxy-L-arabinose transferase-like glycosyltransferase
MRPSKYLTALLPLIIVAALGLRLWLIYISPDYAPYAGTWGFVQEAARNLVEGHGCTISQDGQLVPFVVLPPGSVGLLAGTYWVFGEYSNIYLRVLQAIIDSFGCLFMFLIGRNLFGNRIGLISAFLYAIYLPVAFLATWPLYDALMPFMILVSLYFFIKAVRSGALRFYVLSGLIAGLGCYFQPTVLLLPLAFGFGVFVYGLGKSGFWRHIAGTVKVTAVMLVAVVLVISPWMARNFCIYGEVIPMRTGLWQGIWEGFGEFGDNPAGAILDDAYGNNVAKQALGEDTKPLSRDTEAFFRAKVMTTIREHPAWWVGMLVKRMPRTVVNFSELGVNMYSPFADDSAALLAYLYHNDLNAIGYNYAIGGLVSGIRDGTFWGVAKQNPYGLVYFGLVGAFAFVPALLSVVGIWAMRRKWRLLALIATVPVYISVVHMLVFVVSFKSIVPASLGYIMFSAIAVGFMMGKRRLKKE